MTHATSQNFPILELPVDQNQTISFLSSAIATP